MQVKINGKEINLKQVSLVDMFHTLVYEIATNYKFATHKFYWFDDEEFHEIVEVDLMRGRFITDNGDFSEYEWELNENRIYMYTIED